MFNADIRALVVFIIVVFAGVYLAQVLGSVDDWYRNLQRPPLTPPNWLFGPVWTVLYIMIAVSGWQAWKAVEGELFSLPLLLWVGQFILNIAWTPAFFGLHRLDIALLIIIALLVSIIVYMVVVYPYSRSAALLMLPYLLWVSFATYLNAGFLRLN